MAEYFILNSHKDGYITEDNKVTPYIGEAKAFKTFKDAELAAKEMLLHYVIDNITILSVKTKILKRYAKRMQIVCLDKE